MDFSPELKKAWEKALMDKLMKVTQLDVLYSRTLGIKGEWELCRMLKAEALYFGRPWGQDNTDQDLGL